MAASDFIFEIARNNIVLGSIEKRDDDYVFYPSGAKLTKNNLKYIVSKVIEFNISDDVESHCDIDNETFGSAHI